MHELYFFHWHRDEEDTFKILLATDIHLGYLEKDAIRGNDSYNTMDEILSYAKAKQVGECVECGVEWINLQIRRLLSLSATFSPVVSTCVIFFYRLILSCWVVICSMTTSPLDGASTTASHWWENTAWETLPYISTFSAIRLWTSTQHSPFLCNSIAFFRQKCGILLIECVIMSMFYRFPWVNYQDENLNISIPVFSIHGNHDDPTGVSW